MKMENGAQAIDNLPKAGINCLRRQVKEHRRASMDGNRPQAWE
jgi:hypothetical protein